MKARIAVVGGVLASLVFGGLAGAWVAGSESFAATAESPLRFTVPVARMGEEREYVVYWRELQRPDGSESNRTGYYLTGSRVEGIEQAMDRTTMVHDVVVIKGALDRGSMGPGPQSKIGTTYVDLETRDEVAGKGRGQEPPFGGIVSPGAWAGAHYGPWAESPYEYLLYDFPIFPNGMNLTYAVQGRTLELGQDLTAEELSPGFRSAIEGMKVELVTGWREYRMNDYRFRSWVDQTGRIGEYEVFSIVRELWLDYRAIDYRNSETQERKWVQDQRAVFWFSPEVGLVRIEWKFARSGTPYLSDPSSPTRDPWREWEDDPIWNYIVVQDLARYKAGTEPIPWGDCSADEHYADENVHAERSGPGLLHPTDGAGSRLPYPLGRALASLENDPTLTEFREWRARHPENVLVGFLFRPRLDPFRPPSSPYFTYQSDPSWRLVYASPTARGSPEQTFVVDSLLQSETNEIINRALGSDTLGPREQFALADLPKGPVTIAYLDDTWHSLAPSAATAAIPDYVRWGYQAGTQGTAPNATDKTRPSVYGRTIWLEILAIGNYPHMSPGTESVAEGMKRAELEVEAESGNLRGLFLFEYATPYNLTATAGEILPVEDQAGPEELESADVRSYLAGTLAAVSLFAIFIAAYFMPFLKYLGGQLVTILPGYAKLRKSELLNHKAREGLLQLIREEPGISPPELHGRVGGGWSTVVYHLTVLEKNQLVSSLIDGRHKRFFPTEAIDWSRRGSLAALRNARTKALYQLIEEDPGAIQAHLARRLGVSVAATQWHLERLQRAELVGGERRGRKVHYFPVGPQPAAPTPKEAVEVA